MIKSFAHKGLKDFYETGSKKGIQPEHASKLARMLDRLDASTSAQDMNLPGYRLHPLKGDKKDMWSVTVNGNWRMTFYFEDEDAYLVDYNYYDQKKTNTSWNCILRRCDETVASNSN